MDGEIIWDSKNEKPPPLLNQLLQEADMNGTIDMEGQAEVRELIERFESLMEGRDLEKMPTGREIDPGDWDKWWQFFDDYELWDFAPPY